ncbi:putative bifunctional diguanylate cyclase/phosphodiesterase [Thiocystis violacea]|uniref:putative bifunctional diguanylate cyclase/phosphodiesterase n=1 Tax=Thiocystis violacea TaxID=13725 RepID=UPI001A92914D|nr:bifunctional diguanylate cyclase/phosphodiesterase [Thiocystis violacea]
MPFGVKDSAQEEMADPVTLEATPAPIHSGTAPRIPAALASALARRDQTDKSAGMLAVLSLSEYRTIQAVFGHASARSLLAEVSAKLLAVLRDDDLLVALGDGELAVLIHGVTEAGAAVVIAERLIHQCRGVYQLGQQRVQARAHLGIARFPSDSSDPAELLRQAHIALHEAKAPHAAPYQLFSHSLSEKLRERVWLAAELEAAIEEGRLELHYQPLFAMDSRQTIGAEALLRLRSTKGELIVPNRFIPLAEEFGLIVPIGTWVLNEACQQLAQWRSVRSLRMAVNVSPIQLADPAFGAIIDAAIMHAGIDYDDLVLEITESVLLDCLPFVEKSFRELTDRGVHIALDDFGTGFSSLSYLTRLSFSTVKIDRTFIQCVPDDIQATRVTSAVIAMAHELGMTVVAEGVETEQQFRFLAKAGCQFGQGFGYSRPQLPEHFLSVISKTMQCWE